MVIRVERKTETNSIEVRTVAAAAREGGRVGIMIQKETGLVSQQEGEGSRRMAVGMVFKKAVGWGWARLCGAGFVSGLFIGSWMLVSQFVKL